MTSLQELLYKVIHPATIFLQSNLVQLLWECVAEGGDIELKSRPYSRSKSKSLCVSDACPLKYGYNGFVKLCPKPSPFSNGSNSSLGVESNLIRSTVSELEDLTWKKKYSVLDSKLLLITEIFMFYSSTKITEWINYKFYYLFTYTMQVVVWLRTYTSEFTEQRTEPEIGRSLKKKIIIIKKNYKQY